MGGYRARIRRAANLGGRYDAYEYACTCGAVGGRSAFEGKVRKSRDAHLRKAHGQ